jgi:hypothetical protein
MRGGSGLTREVTMEAEVRAIVEEIRSAFAGVPRGAITIHEAEVIDVYGTDARRRRARLLDTEDRWDEVPDPAIEECTTALCYLDPEGWRFYLPAYMVWTLHHFRTTSSMVRDQTIYALDLSLHDPGVREHQVQRFQVLDGPQSRAVCRFLRYMADHDDVVDGRVARQALAAYWERFGG